MSSGPGQRSGRRDSIPQSPPSSHDPSNPGARGGADPEAARILPTQSVTFDGASQEQGGSTYNNISTSEDASTRSSTPAQRPDTVQQEDLDPMSHEALMDDVDMFIEGMENGGRETYWFHHATTSPPITAESLAELDLSRIINNPKLRHDVNFDRELHFRPNLDGHRGQRKIKSADSYWQALAAELHVYGEVLRHARDATEASQMVYYQAVIQEAQRRLPKLFEAARDVLKTLVPDYERRHIDERFDVPHMMQEISNGVCDLESISNWLAKVLQAHCAPMRDHSVENMKRRIHIGTQENSPQKLADGLRQLITILENMKLDVANHQIRHMRPLLIADTINFQCKYNFHRMRIGKINAAVARRWLYKEIDYMTDHDPAGEPTHLVALVQTFLRDTILRTGDCWPETFYLDTDRLRVLRHELHARVYHAVCLSLFLELLYEQASQVQQFNAIDLKYHLHCRINDIVGTGSFYDHREAIAAEMVRLLLYVTGHAPPYVNSDLILRMEQRLNVHLTTADEAVHFHKHASELFTRLLPRLQFNVSSHMQLSTLDLQDALVPRPQMHHPSPFGFGAILIQTAPQASWDGDYDIVRKLAHVVVLHWHVWGEMVYMASPEEDFDEDGFPQGGPSANSSRAMDSGSSQTVPVAQAVYAPGARWLPVSVTVTDVPSRPPQWTEDPTDEQ